MSKIRTFVATPLIDLESLKNWVLNLSKESFSGKITWTNPNLWHLTFKFIGNIDQSQLNPLKTSLERALKGGTTGHIDFEGLGYFGSFKSPKVIWAGIRHSGWLEAIKQRVEEGVSVLGLPEEDRVFKPHLTLARVKYINDSKSLMTVLKQKEDFKWGVCEVNRVVLYQSVLTSEGPVYSNVESFTLG